MKTLCLSLLFTLAVALAPRVSAQSATPSPAPAASPLPATEPEPATSGDKQPAAKPMECCPMCKDDQGGVAKDKAPAANPADDEKAVVALETRWCEAEAAHDVAFLEKVEADGFTFTDSSGKLTTKQDEIAEAKRGGDKIDFKLSEMKAHLHGNTAVLTGVTTFTSPEVAPVSAAYRWTDVFVRQANGEWQVVASQATALNQHGDTEESRTE